MMESRIRMMYDLWSSLLLVYPHVTDEANSCSELSATVVTGKRFRISSAA